VIPRTVPPVHSPISLAAVRRAWRGRVRGDVRALLLKDYDARDVLLTDSGTSALALALRLAVAHRPQSPRVALPAWACYDLATAADTADIEVVLYDVDPATLGPDWSSLDRVLAAGVAAIVVVHAHGVPVNLTEASARAGRAGALVIEDAAQGIGCTLGGRPAGSWGDLGVMSFGRGKGWTGGGGGALLLGATAPPEIALPPPEAPESPEGRVGIAAKLTLQWLLARPGIYAVPSALPFLKLGQTVYRPVQHFSLMSNAQEAVLLETARCQKEEADRRRDNAARLRRSVEENSLGQVPMGWEGGSPGWLRLPVLLGERGLGRAGASSARRLGIMPGYPIPLSRLPGFQARLPRGGSDFPGAEVLARRLYTFPTHGLLSESDLDRLDRWCRA